MAGRFSPAGARSAWGSPVSRNPAERRKRNWSKASGPESRRGRKSLEAVLALHRLDPFVGRGERDAMALRLRTRKGGVRRPQGLEVELLPMDRMGHRRIEFERLQEADREI